MELDHRISALKPLDFGRIHLEFTDGSSGMIDLSPQIDAGGVFTPMADPVVFSSVQVARGGRSLEWPCGVDLCADALWMETHGIDLRVGFPLPGQAS